MNSNEIKKKIHGIFNNIEINHVDIFEQCTKHICTAQFTNNKVFFLDELIVKILNDPEAWNELQKLRNVQKMSTIAVGYLIYKLTQIMPEGGCYLNIGTWKGYTLLAGMLNHERESIGVDSFQQFQFPKEEFYKVYEQFKHEKTAFHEMQYQHYFQNIHEQKPISFYFYDGAHDYEYQYESLELAHPYLLKNSFILVDDTNVIDPRKATFDFLLKHNNEYEIVLDQLTANNGHPSFHNGIMLLLKVR